MNSSTSTTTSNASGNASGNALGDALASAPVVPVVVLEDASHAVPVANALLAGGLGIMEITLRTECAPDAIAAIAQSVPEVAIGAGTVLNGAQYRIATETGARFIVSPGLDEEVVRLAGDDGIPVYPGVATAGELQRAWNLGVRIVKFFPAGQAGGVPMLKALSAVFRDVQFIPTGGVSASNLGDYLSVPSVIACGGSWLTPGDAIASGDFDRIEGLAREAVGIAAKHRG